MQSVTKAKIETSDLQRIIDAWQGKRTRLLSSTELREGFYNASFLVELGNGSRVVVKLAPNEKLPVMRYERGIMTSEVTVLRHLRTTTQVPVPAVLHHDKTKQIVPHEYFIMEFVNGRPLHHLRKELTPREAHEIDCEIGAHVRAINEQIGTSFGYVSPVQPRFDRWANAFDHMLTDVLCDGEDAGVQLEKGWADIHRLCRSVYASLDEIREPRLVHWDVWDGNVFVDHEQLGVVAIIDCERALWGDPLLEVNFRGFNSSDSFAEGYGQPMLSTEPQRTRSTLYDVYLYLIMVIECTYRSYPSDDQEQWARGKLHEALHQLSIKEALA